MKLILFTQDDPFYLPETIEDFIDKVKKRDQEEDPKSG